MAETISMPKLGFDMSEGTLVRWVKREGESIAKGDVLAEIETDKATVEVESSATGVVKRLLAEPGQVVPVGAPIAVVGGTDEKLDGLSPGAQAAPQKDVPAKIDPDARVVSAVAPSGVKTTQTDIPTDGQVRASPLARKVARDAAIDLASVKGSGPGGRIVRRDIEDVRQKASIGGPARQSARRPLAAAPIAREEKSIKMSRLRSAIARRMTQSKTTVPHFYVTSEYASEALVAARRQLQEYLQDSEQPSINDFIVRAAALTLIEFPNLNASFAEDAVVHHGQVNVGIAVAVENGLLTVVCRDADQKSLLEIAREVKELVARARAGKVRPEDIEDSTFSVSNLGMYEVENFVAILNPPEAAILAVGTAREVPVVDSGQIRPGWRMKATLSVDHRVSDGAEAARFMKRLGEYLHNPARLLI